MQVRAIGSRDDTFEVALCSLHAAELAAGTPWMLDSDQGVLLLGPDLKARGLHVAQSATVMHTSDVLGDGVESSRVTRLVLEYKALPGGGPVEVLELVVTPQLVEALRAVNLPVGGDEGEPPYFPHL